MKPENVRRTENGPEIIWRSERGRPLRFRPFGKANVSRSGASVDSHGPLAGNWLDWDGLLRPTDASVPAIRDKGRQVAFPARPPCGETPAAEPSGQRCPTMARQRQVPSKLQRWSRHTRPARLPPRRICSAGTGTETAAARRTSRDLGSGISGPEGPRKSYHQPFSRQSCSRIPIL